MVDTLLINSAAYVDQELAGEIGILPPAFAPAQNRRLYDAQLAEVTGMFDRIYLSLPQDYEVDPIDLARLKELGVITLTQDAALTLSESLLLSINTIAGERATTNFGIAILHGDTLIKDLSPEEDVLSVGEAVPEYAWAGVRVGESRITEVFTLADPNDRADILTGYFSFSSASNLKQCLEQTSSFVDALNSYVHTFPVRPLWSKEWYDFGHIHTFFKARQKLTSERAFNSLHIAGRVTNKRSDNAVKMTSEANWYESVPQSLRVYLPQFLGMDDDGKGYRLEYLYLMPLSDLFVFGELPSSVWTKILRSCAVYMSTVSNTTGAGSAVQETLHADKTRHRLSEFDAQYPGISKERWTVNGCWVPSLEEIAEEMICLVDADPVESQALQHGDLCLSNILWDSRTEDIKLIDPRGVSADGQPAIYGDPRYDMAKLCHSVLCGYDLILASRYSLSQAGSTLSFALHVSDRQRRIQDKFRDIFADSFADPTRHRAVMAMTVLLFVSMLPLHFDDPVRQRALHVNALDLYRTVFGVGGSCT